MFDVNTEASTHMYKYHICGIIHPNNAMATTTK
jgi:hypothetical protein